MTAKIRMPSFCQILSQFPTFKQYLIFRVINYYNDEMKLFMLKYLRQITYMKDLDVEIILHISFWMTLQHIDAGTILLDAGTDSDTYSELGKEMMFVVFEGLIEITLKVDQGTDIVLGQLGRGSVVRSKHFLIERDSKVTFRAITRCRIYTLKQDVLILLSLMYY